LSTHLRLGLPSGLFTSGFPTNILYAFLLSPIRAACPARLILLDLITLIMLGEEYKLSHSNSAEYYYMFMIRGITNCWTKERSFTSFLALEGNVDDEYGNNLNKVQFKLSQKMVENSNP
jgi:hypothetical protein